MRTPFEDLEFLAEYLPDEGEAVIVARRDGELVCEPFRQENSREGLLDMAFYGRLVHASERLSSVSALPLWLAAGFAFALCVGQHKLFGIGWSGWYLDVGVVLLVLGGTLAWIQWQQGRIFTREIRPMLVAQLDQRALPRFALVGIVRQHSELRSLLYELVRWKE